MVMLSKFCPGPTLRMSPEFSGFISFSGVTTPCGPRTLCVFYTDGCGHAASGRAPRDGPRPRGLVHLASRDFRSCSSRPGVLSVEWPCLGLESPRRPAVAAAPTRRGEDGGGGGRQPRRRCRFNAPRPWRSPARGSRAGPPRISG
jgi:hypothetical protein